jgi:hypothetical protein
VRFKVDRLTMGTVSKKNSNTDRNNRILSFGYSYKKLLEQKKLIKV